MHRVWILIFLQKGNKKSAKTNPLGVASGKNLISYREYGFLYRNVFQQMTETHLSIYFITFLSLKLRKLTRAMLNILIYCYEDIVLSFLPSCYSKDHSPCHHDCLFLNRCHKLQPRRLRTSVLKVWGGALCF